jgi:hypothetical protein
VSLRIVTGKDILYITNYDERLPVTINIMAAKGRDGMLFSLIQSLVKEEIARC